MVMMTITAGQAVRELEVIILNGFRMYEVEGTCSSREFL